METAKQDRAMEARMTRDHARWEEFCERLAGPEGCNFSDDGWLCAGGRDKTFATAILESMGGIDVAASLSYFERNGGYCDCEILFNVDVRDD